MWLEFRRVLFRSKELDGEGGYKSGYYEWQMEHLVEEIDEKEYQSCLNNVLDTIFKGDTMKEFDNFSIGELESRYKKL